MAETVEEFLNGLYNSTTESDLIPKDSASLENGETLGEDTNNSINSTTINTIIGVLQQNGDQKIQALGQRLAVLQLQDIQGETNIQIQKLFELIQEIGNDSFGTDDIISLRIYVGKIEELYKQFQDEKSRVTTDSKTASGAIFPNEYLDENDIPYLEGIKGSLEGSESMNIDELFEAAKSIELSGKIEGSKAWDDFFTDLRNEVPQEKLEEFDTEVEKFKTSQETKDIYQANIEMGGTNSHFDTILDQLQKGELDEALNTGYKIPLPLEEFGIDDIGVGPFYTKIEAIRTIYKLKLVFQQIENDGTNMINIGWYSGVTQFGETGLGWAGEQVYGENGMYGDVVDGQYWQLPLNVIQAGIIGSLTLLLTAIGYALPTGAMLYLWGKPLDGGMRRVKDYLAVRFGDKGWSKPIQAFSKYFRVLTHGLIEHGWKGTIGGKKMSVPIPLLNGLLKGTNTVLRPFTFLAGVGLKPVDLFIGSSGKILEGAEKIHLDPTHLISDRILLLDGLGGNIGDSTFDSASSDGAIEIRSRVKILSLFKRIAEFEGDTKTLELLNKLWDTNLNSNSESFYIDLDNILNKKQENPIWKKGVRSIADTYLFLNKKEGILKRYDEMMRKFEAQLSVVYKGVSVNYASENISTRGKINIPENAEYTEFMKKMIADIDFSLIPHGEEERREKLIQEFIDEMKRGNTGILSADDVKEEVRKITEGVLPKFKIIKEIKEALKKAGSNPTTLENLEKFRKLVLEGKWYGTPAELSSLLANINTTPAIIYQPPLRTLEEIQKNGDTLKKLSIRGSREFSEISQRSFYDADKKMVEMMLDMGVVSGDINSREAQFRYFLNDVGSTVKKLDWTQGEFYFAIEQILVHGKKYDPKGNGTFGETIDLRTMEADYGNFDDRRNQRIVDIISQIRTLSDDEKLMKVLEIEKDAPLEALLKNHPEYKKLKGDMDPIVLAKMRGVKTEIDDLGVRRNSIIGKMTFNKDEGASVSIESENSKIVNKLAELERDFNNLQKGYGVNMKDRILFLVNVDTSISSLNTDLTRLESSINTYMGRSPTTGSIPKAPPPAPATGPSVSLETLKQNAYDFADRAILEAALQGDNFMDNPRFSAQVQTEIRNTLKTARNIDDAGVRTIIEALSGKTLPATIRDIGSIKSDFLARINAKSLTDTERLRINGEFMNLRTLPSLREALKPGNILKMIL